MCCNSVTSLKKGLLGLGSTYVVGSFLTLVALAAYSERLQYVEHYDENEDSTEVEYYIADREILYCMTTVSFLQFLASLLLMYGTARDLHANTSSWLLYYTITVSLYALMYTSIAILCFLTFWPAIGKFILAGAVVNLGVLVYCLVVLQCWHRQIKLERRPASRLISPPSLST